MIIIRISSGLANATMEFCAGYALARELGDDDIVLDIGQCQDSAWGYCVDYLNIPDYVKKSYHTINSSSMGHTNPSSVPDTIRKDSIIIDRSVYSSLEQADSLKKTGSAIYLCDYFFDPYLFYNKYWEELRPLLMFKGKSDNIESFRKLIHGRTSIGIHIRRGDMLYADFATQTIDDYYKAAIEYCKSKIDKDAVFCVFSDDIKYAENLLGGGTKYKVYSFYRV